MRITVAIDGPAGAGKSTIAKIIGDRFDLMYINTGAMYRAVALKALEKNISHENINELCSLIDSLDMKFEEEKLIINGEDVSDQITTPYISSNVSNYAAVYEVREKLVDMQRYMSEKYNVIMDGRDIGTVVLKDASFKFFLTASCEERANRRYKELKEKNINVLYENVLNDIIKRDYIDSNREVNPLRKACDAIEIDCSKLSILEVVDIISNYIKKVI
ncbi:MAG: (d)CMP kinase [Clostridiaceae bacterium]